MTIKNLNNDEDINDGASLVFLYAMIYENCHGPIDIFLEYHKIQAEALIEKNKSSQCPQQYFLPIEIPYTVLALIQAQYRRDVRDNRNISKS